MIEGLLKLQTFEVQLRAGTQNGVVDVRLPLAAPVRPKRIESRKRPRPVPNRGVWCEGKLPGEAEEQLQHYTDLERVSPTVNRDGSMERSRMPPPPPKVPSLELSARLAQRYSASEETGGSSAYQDDWEMPSEMEADQESSGANAPSRDRESDAHHESRR